MKVCYQYNLEGYYLGETHYSKSNLPVNTTKIKPSFKKGFIPKWNGKAWEQIENHIGETGYINRVQVTITEYGPLPEGWSTEIQPLPFEEQLVLKKAELETDFDTTSESKLTFLDSSLGFPINANTTANRNIQGLISSMELNSLDTKLFMDFNNIPHELTLEEMKTLYKEILQFGEDLYEKKWILRTHIEACEDVTCLDKIQWDFYLNPISSKE